MVEGYALVVIFIRLLDIYYVTTDSFADVLLSDFWEQVEDGFFVESCPVRLTDFMPCHDPKRAKSFAKERNHYRERHCPPAEEKLKCLIPPPVGYQIPLKWPETLDKVSSNFVLVHWCASQ